MVSLKLISGVVLCYLFGSIPFSYLIAHWAKGIDLRLSGEGNVGARNVWHSVGKVYGFLAGFLDFSKGVAAWAMGKLLALDSPEIWALGLAAVIGHAFPVFLRGRGGKGAATAMGFVFCLSPLALIIAGATMGLAFLVFHDFHLAVAPGMALLPILWIFVFNKSWTEIGLLLAMLFFLGLKRIIDQPYMKKIKAQTGWDKS
ncbi:MAG: glycerol-3-phosphate acyltransferase [Candidatus Aminicenantes bacterium]|nr:glycerol-3-phosphate acyltransferase [Candidatus Aminicenantes bacterium]